MPSEEEQFNSYKEVLDNPILVKKAHTFDLSNCAVSDGVKSCATTIVLYSLKLENNWRP